MAKKLTDKQKRIKKEQEERKQRNKMASPKVNIESACCETIKDMEITKKIGDSYEIKYNMEWFSTEYLRRKHFSIYDDFIRTYTNKNSFWRDIDFENYNYWHDNCNYGARNYTVEYFGESDYLKDIASCIEKYRSRQYKEACICFTELIEKYPNEGWLYYYFGKSFSYAYGIGSGGAELYSLRFYKKAVELKGCVEMYLDYAIMLRICGDILARSGMSEYARRLYNCALDIYDEAEKKYPQCGNINNLRNMVPLYEGNNSDFMESLSMKSYTFDEESREWITENLLFKIEDDLLIN